MLGPIDYVTSWILMAVGAVVLFFGLYLILRPSAHGAKFELFGLKFESSSAGILVFLVGTALLVNPLYVARSGTVGGGAALATEGGALSVEGGRAIFAEGAEAEPNDSIAAPNVIAPGAVISGELSEDDVDFYRVALPDGFQGEMAVNVDGTVRLQVFDDLGVQIASKLGSAVSFRERARGSVYSLKLSKTAFGERFVPYELTLAVSGN